MYKNLTINFEVKIKSYKFLNIYFKIIKSYQVKYFCYGWKI